MRLGAHVTTGLGSAACVNCRVRYSEGNDRWECWHYVKRPHPWKDGEYELQRCSAQVTAANNYTCTEKHVDPDKFQVRVTPVSPPRYDFYDDQQHFSVSANFSTALLHDDDDDDGVMHTTS